MAKRIKTKRDHLYDDKEHDDDVISHPRTGELYSRKPKVSDDELLTQLEEGLKIDQHGLDDALMQQPDSFYRVSKQLALLISKRDAAKQERENVEARVDGLLRRGARDRESKMTEKEIDAQKHAHADVVHAIDQYLQLNAEVGQWTALKEAFQQRSYAIHKLVDLYVGNYWESSGATRSNNSMRDVEARQNRAAMNDERRRQRND